MNKQEFINELARRTKLSKKDAQSALDTALHLIMGSVAKKQKITFTGFGTFESARRSSTTRINPQTRERFTVPAKVVPKFRAGKGFKEAVSRGR